MLSHVSWLDRSQVAVGEGKKVKNDRKTFNSVGRGMTGN